MWFRRFRKGRTPREPDSRSRRRRVLLLCAAAALAFAPARAQLDPERRRLIQAGWGPNFIQLGPTSGYLFYYYNQPRFRGTDQTLRLALAPVYADAELGLPKALGPRTDVSVRFAGGGFADSYNEFRKGDYVKGESFLGHGLRASLSLYHRLNPEQRLPATAVLRAEPRFAFFTGNGSTRADFNLPRNEQALALRAGVRVGGVEPLIAPRRALELSGWYEARLRLHPGPYGLDGDRATEAASHLFFFRQVLIYTKDNETSFQIGLTEGASKRADRFSAYRLGGMLTLTSEFPLLLPGYNQQELSARSFGVLDAHYGFPLTSGGRWAVVLLAGGAWVDYLPGLEQPGRWHMGGGAGLRYRPRAGPWQAQLGYAYGATAIRGDSRGAHSLAILVQYDFDRVRGPFLTEPQNPFFRNVYERFWFQ